MKSKVDVGGVSIVNKNTVLSVHFSQTLELHGLLSFSITNPQNLRVMFHETGYFS